MGRSGIPKAPHGRTWTCRNKCVRRDCRAKKLREGGAASRGVGFDAQRELAAARGSAWSAADRAQHAKRGCERSRRAIAGALAPASRRLRRCVRIDLGIPQQTEWAVANYRWGAGRPHGHGSDCRPLGSTAVLTMGLFRRRPKVAGLKATTAFRMSLIDPRLGVGP